MKKKCILRLIIFCFVIFFSLSVCAEDKDTDQKSAKVIENKDKPHNIGLTAKNKFDQIDTLWAEGMDMAYHQNGLMLVRKSLKLCEVELDKTPNDYETLWRFTRSAAYYGQVAKILQYEGWKDLCYIWGKRGMKTAEEAIRISPHRVEAYYWQTVAIGKYSDAVGFTTAIREGFYGKSVRNLKKACEIDRSYMDFSPVWATAMFNWKLPWPLKKKKKALENYKEWAKLSKWEWEDYDRYTSGAEFLMSMGKSYWSEAKQLLDITLSSPHQYPYYHNIAKVLRSKIEN